MKLIILRTKPNNKVIGIYRVGFDNGESYLQLINSVQFKDLYSAKIVEISNPILFFAYISLEFMNK